MRGSTRSRRRCPIHRCWPSARPCWRCGARSLIERFVASVVLAAVALLAGCASGPRGRDGAEANPPAGLAQVPDAEPRIEPIGGGGTSKPYTVLGRSYVPITDDRPLRQSGLASWYGRKFQGQSTASGERYDMYAMTAAHKTLPLPSYVRVRNPANGREVIVRVNDRGPFHDDRIIDLSYTAALKLDLLRGVAPVEIERITNEDIRTGAWRRPETDADVAVASARARVPVASAAAGASDGSGVSSSTIVSSTSAAPVLMESSPPVSRSGVDVPAAMTSPVVAMPRTEVRELEALRPLSIEPPSASASPSTAGGPEAKRGEPAPPRLSASAPARAGFWVQLGAFSQRSGADTFQRQVSRRLPALADSLNVFAENGTYRLQTGPYASRESARETADRVRDGMQMEPLIVERR
ncbi:MAG: septal ring lytic transglycosylase RlpA family protein [Gammaproteobacteria bacterium]|nr:septal ring lytic transglycosylase RlpA family protein [Gammaproteobacteria bacterium]